MANKLKTKKSQLPDPEILKPEIEEKVNVQELVKDERTSKILGSLFLLIAIFLLIAFTSYLSTWKEDQDKVFNGSSILLPSSKVEVQNLLGNLGAYISHQFFYNAFGVASYLFCTFFFIAGINLLMGRKVFSLARNLRYVIVGLPYLSILFAFLTKGSQFPWGGALGEVSSDWLTRFLGWIGTAVLLAVAGLAYFIWRFNPVFALPKRKAVIPAVESDELTMTTSEDMPADLPEEEDDIVYADEDLKLTINEYHEKSARNSLKSEGGIVVIHPASADTLPVNQFTLSEREEEVVAPVKVKPVKPLLTVSEPRTAVEETLISVIAPSKTVGPQIVLPDLELEIKAVPKPEEDEDEPEVDIKPRQITEEAYEPTLDLRDYKYPGLDLLEAHGSEKIVQDPAELEANKNQIINTLKNYDISIQKISATVGPTVTLYEIVPAAGVRISRIKNLEDDIALSLAALGIRIIAPIPGKGTIGIEVPNVNKKVVSMKTLLASDKFQVNSYNLPIAIGKKIDNENFIVDLAAMPHLLMAGATGQGKSVGLNAILVSLLYKKHPSQLKFVLIDPKKVELSIYKTIENHFLAKLPGEDDSIITDTKKVIHTLNALCIEMDNRYDLLKEAGTRNIREYNEKFVKRRLNPQKGHQYLPFIVLVIDEFADLIMTAGKEVEMPIARLAQLARAVGIHLIIATQRPSVNIITGTIKANFPARIAFKVSSKIDSRTILDTGGAEQLIGKGDMLISYNGELTRLQCAFVDTPEVEEVTSFIGNQRGYPQPFLLPEYVDEKELEGKNFDATDKDPLFEDAAKIIVQNQMGSTSLLQRRMKLGYNRAGRLMDQLEATGVVGPNQGSKV
ncbi:MAG: DNA translocase FtsK, partial [Chitinophagaceae bacterium]